MTITTETAGPEIYYTVDGSSPLDIAEASPSAALYTGPIPITTTTCLRAVAYRFGWVPTNVDTHTYIFPGHVVTQATDPQTGAQVTPPGLPASWGSVPGDYQVDPDVVGQNGKDKFNGLYAKTIQDDLKIRAHRVPGHGQRRLVRTQGHLHQSIPGRHGTSLFPGMDRSQWRGRIPDQLRIAMQGGAKHDGGGTSLKRWKVFKLSMRPRFKTNTDDGKPTGGPTTLNYRVFPDSPITTFDTFVLDEVMTNAWNHTGQHMYGTYIQDQYVSDLHNAMGGYSPHGLYAHLYINGLYWGMYYVHERPDDAWAAEMFGGEKEEYECSSTAPPGR